MPGAAGGDPRDRTVKGILIAGTETDDTPNTSAPRPLAMLRGPEAIDTERTD